MRSPFAALPGAVVPEGAQAPAHYGNPLGEQRRLAQGAAIVHLGDRRVLTLTGPDRLGWLDSISSQELKSLQPGVSTETLILDPQGHIEHQANLVDDGERLWLIVDQDDAEPLQAWLTRMRFRMQVEIADVTDEFAVLGWVDRAGGAAGALVAGEGAAGEGAAAAPRIIWRDPWASVSPGGYQYASGAQHPAAAWAWTEAIVPSAMLTRIAAALAAAGADASPAGTSAAEALRVEAWRPRWSAEVDEKSLPHESDWLRSAVHLNKGCYRGQETVAKVHNLGRPPRRMVLLHLDGSQSTLPQPGAAVLRQGTVDDSGAPVAGAEVGHVTSAALHYELGPIALAVIKRNVPVDETLEVEVDDGRLPATQEVIVPPDAGATANVPRLPRIGGRPRR